MFSESNKTNQLSDNKIKSFGLINNEPESNAAYLIPLPELSKMKIDNKYNNNYKCKKIMIVEDNTINIKVIKRLLNECGIENITISKNGKEALDAFSKDLDLIILDIGLPDMSGIEVFTKMKSQLKDAHIPIVACTANVEFKAKCIEAGMDGFITKPLLLAELKKVISDFC